MLFSTVNKFSSTLWSVLLLFALLSWQILLLSSASSSLFICFSLSCGLSSTDTVPAFFRDDEDEEDEGDGGEDGIGGEVEVGGGAVVVLVSGVGRGIEARAGNA